MKKEDIRDFFERNASSRLKWMNRNRYYHKSLQRYFSLIIPQHSRVIEIGCGTGDLLAAMKPSYGVGIDYSPAIIDIAVSRHPDLRFIVQDVDDLEIQEKFDFIILSDLAGSLWDIQKTFHQLRKLCNPGTRLVISSYNYFWEGIMNLGEFLHLKLKQPKQNWLSVPDIQSLLYLEDFQVISINRKLLIPKRIFGLNYIFNRIIANLPIVNKLDLVNIIVARSFSQLSKEFTTSIVIPARNEHGNIENAVKRIASFGQHQEIIFVEGNSEDNTFDEMVRVKNAYPNKDIKVLRQSGHGKGNAVREGFDAASGEILMILDADLTVPPEDLGKFYYALQQNKGEFINGCRLVYPMDKEAMRFLNLIANKFFGVFFTFLLGQKIKDTLCGTKVLFKKDYQRIINNRSYFGDFDPFGDFDLLFGAAKLNLKITEVIIRYKEREYGSTQISRFRHGWLLLKMSIFAARKFKFV
jgi:SAM-dependent methyltransferase